MAKDGRPKHKNPSRETCPTCKGSGTIKNSDRRKPDHTCHMCNGAGELVTYW